MSHEHSAAQPKPGPTSRGIDWGSPKAAALAEAQRSAAVAKAAATFKGLLDRPRTPATPWLVIPAFAGDPGMPRPIPNSHPFWESPNIWIETPDALGNPVAGQPNHVHARIFNLGAHLAAPVKVDFYWGDPSVGLDAAHMHRIGDRSEYVQIPPLQVVDVRCTAAWVPLFKNGGHECLIVNCTNWVADPIQDPFEAVLDRHVAQRNVMVAAAAPGSAVAVNLGLANVLGQAVKTRLVAVLTPAVAFSHPPPGLSPRELAAQVLAFHPSGQHTPGLGFTHHHHQAAKLHAALSAHSHPFAVRKTALRRTTGAAPAHAASPPGHLDLLSAHAVRTPLIETSLQPGERKAVDLQVSVPAEARPGEYFICRLAQVVGDETVGGYTIVVKAGA